MHTTNVTRTNIRETEKNALVLRLETNQKDVDRLRDQLNSYRYEPKTYSLFERMQNLKNGLDQLTKTNSEIIASIRNRTWQTGSIVEEAQKQFTKFELLHQSFEEYIENTIITRDSVQQIA